MSTNKGVIKIIERVFTFIFNLLYNQFAWSYDLIAWIVSSGLWKKWVFSSLAELPEHGRILELGFGPGHLQLQGTINKSNMFGVDMSPNMVKLCAKRLSTANLPLQISRADAMQLPFESKVFSAAIATFPAPYIFAPQTLIEIYRVLQTDGTLLIVPTAWSTSKAPLQRFFSWLFNLSNNSTNSPEDNFSAVLERLEKHNFTVTHKIINVKKSKVLFFSAVKHEKLGN